MCQIILNNYEFILAIFSALIATGGLIFNARSIKEQTKTREIEILNDFSKRLMELERELNIINDEYSEDEKELSKKRSEWDSIFFNTIEQLSFLRNHNHFSTKICEFFDDYIIHTYDDIFVKHMVDAVDDPKRFEEYKKYYNQVKK